MLFAFITVSNCGRKFRENSSSLATHMPTCFGHAKSFSRWNSSCNYCVISVTRSLKNSKISREKGSLNLSALLSVKAWDFFGRFINALLKAFLGRVQMNLYCGTTVVSCRSCSKFILQLYLCHQFLQYFILYQLWIVDLKHVSEL